MQKKMRNRKTPFKKREEGTNLRSVMIAATLAAPIGQDRGPWPPPPFSSPEPRRYAPGDHEQQQFLQSRPVKDGKRLGRDGTILRLQNQPHQSRSQMSESRMPNTGCKITFSKPW